REHGVEYDVHAPFREHAGHGGEHEDAHWCPHGDGHVEHVEVVPVVVPAVDHGEHDDVHHDQTQDHVDPEHQIGAAMASMAAVFGTVTSRPRSSVVRVICHSILLSDRCP